MSPIPENQCKDNNNMINCKIYFFFRFTVHFGDALDFVIRIIQ
jgi:hypothetical protein